MNSNFTFLREDFPVFAKLGGQAESLKSADSHSALMKIGLLTETVVKWMCNADDVYKPADVPQWKLYRAINELYAQDLLPGQTKDVLHILREFRNKPAHTLYEDEETVEQLLPIVHSLLVWFFTTYGPLDAPPPSVFNKHLEVPVFVLSPVDADEVDAATALRAQQEQEDAEYVSRADRVRRAIAAEAHREKSEEETRIIIDKQLREVGWEANTDQLRYAKEIRPEHGRNLAIAEWPTESGNVDYALFIGTRLVAVVEAKKFGTDVSSVLDVQAKRYARHIKVHDEIEQLGQWDEFRVPFVFATNGRPYHEQVKLKSGVWFQDVRNPYSTPETLRGWYSPQNLSEILKESREAANDKLAALGDKYLTDKNGLSLHDYQQTAILAIERALLAGCDSALLAMATGTGKTRTALGLIYRLLASGRAKRILFLVDRNALGSQALGTFNEVHLEQGMSLDEIYSIQGLENPGLDTETKVKIATVQSLVRNLFGQDEEEHEKYSVGDFDVIIVDEAHRGYGLDQEMSEEELEFRNSQEFVSLYRQAIEYFDAFKIGLTATPAVHTTEIFGKPIFTYSYRQAVLEGRLVDHNPPVALETKLGKEGVKFKAGEVPVITDRRTGEVLNAEALEDDVNFDIESFNRNVKVSNFNEAVLDEIFQDIDIEAEKTLIFAVDDSHADEIVSILRDISFADSESIMKITGSIENGNTKRIQQAISKFRNEQFPSVVVTVDLLTTGIDIPVIQNLVFMRRVRSRILFEQMLGRATRLCNEIGKTHFNIYDAVGVYDVLSEVSTMKPLVKKVGTSLRQHLQGIALAEEEDTKRNALDQIVGILQRKKRKFSEKMHEHFELLADGNTVEEVVGLLTVGNADGIDTAVEWALGHKELFDILDEYKPQGKNFVYHSDAPDEVISVERLYGEYSRAEDFLEAFNKFINNNANEVLALKILATRPSDLTRKQLQELKLQLDANHFDERSLQTALSEQTSQEVTADIISIIRRNMIGASLSTPQERAEKALNRIFEKYGPFKTKQKQILKDVANRVSKDSVFNIDFFNTDERLRIRYGRYENIAKLFDDSLDEIIDDFNHLLYEEERSA